MFGLRIGRVVAATWMMLLVAIAAPDSRADESHIRIALEGVNGVQASGTARFEILPERPRRKGRQARPAQALLHVSVRRLERDRVYHVRTNGVNRTTFETSRRGSGQVTLHVKPTDGSRPALWADPRGMLISIATPRGEELLAGVLSGPLEPEGIDYDEVAGLEPQTNTVGASATARYKTGRRGSRTFRVDVAEAPVGDYKVRVGGVNQGDFTVGSRRKKRRRVRGSFSVTTASRRGHPASLDFDPRGKRIDVVSSRGSIRFSGLMKAELPANNVAAEEMETVALTLRIPNYTSSKVAGVNIWRIEEGGSSWQKAEQLFLWPPRRTKQGEVVDYSFVDPRTGSVAPTRFPAPAERSTNRDLILTVEFDRPGPAAYFKVSTFNKAGESPRSKRSVFR